MLKSLRKKINSSVSGKTITVMVTLLAMVLFSLTAKTAQAQGDKKELVRKVAKDWISIGEKQYNRGLYVDAEKSFLNASDYTSYLTKEENQMLKKWLEKSHVAVQERSDVEAQLEKAKNLLAQGNADEARSIFERIRDSKALTSAEQKSVSDSLGIIAQQQQNSQSNEMVKRFNESVELFDAGQLEEARKGFLDVSKSGVTVSTNGKTAEDYLAQIDAILVQRAQEAIKPAQPSVEMPAVPAVPKVEVPAAPSVETPEVSGKQNVLRGYANAVVNNAVMEVKNLISEGKFDRARKSVESTMQVVKDNRKDLGEELFQQYVDELTRLTQEILAGEQAHALELKQQHTEMMKKQQEEQIEALAQQTIEYINQKQYDQAFESLKKLREIKNMQLDGEVVK